MGRNTLINSDIEAWNVLKYTHGVTSSGIIYPYSLERKETKMQAAAINYLCAELDYGWAKEKPEEGN